QRCNARFRDESRRRIRRR
ncbi:glutamate synthase, NADH/NADPH, small subunit domain protein, partial [Vibrio parahaemolyticus VPTS-2010_2]